MGWAMFKTPHSESEKEWMRTIKLNFPTNDVDGGVEANMSWRMCQLLCHVPEVPFTRWDSLELRDKLNQK